MGTEAPTIVTIPVYCAPKKAPCPKCGKLGRRKRILPPRRVRTVAYQVIAYLEITCGEYRARCDCCITFRSTPDDVLPRAAYDNKVRDLVLGRIIEDGMSIERDPEVPPSRIPPGPLHRLRLRPAPRPGGATGHGRASPHGPGALQRHPLRR